MDLTPFDKPIYITRPILPDLEKVMNKFQEIWDAEWLTNNGEQVQLFEKKLQNVLKVPFVSAMNNGTSALMIACKALELTGEVITTPFTFPATTHSLTWCGLTPVFCDVDYDTMNIDPEKIEALITPQTSAILAVHVFGTPCYVEKIQKIAEKHNLKVIYDAAHAFGATIGPVGIGNFGDISMFSFHATKLFHTIEGGALTCKDEELQKQINLYRNFGIKNEETVLLPGLNAKMNEIQASIGLLVLDHLENELARRKAIADTYRECLAGIDGITIVKENMDESSYQYFVIRINEEQFGNSRDEVYEKFKKYNVFTRKYFYPLCSDFPHYKDLPSSKASLLPVSHTVVNEVLSMPFYGRLSTDDIIKICDILKSFK